MIICITSPTAASEWDAYYSLRWRVLREPWGQPLGSERDEYEDNSFHVMATDTTTGNLIGVGRLHRNTPQEAQIRYMAVEPNVRQQGVGASLLQALETEARRLGTTTIILNARQAVAGFYTRYGYITIAPSHTLFGAIPHLLMQKHLDKD